MIDDRDIAEAVALRQRVQEEIEKQDEGKHVAYVAPAADAITVGLIVASAVASAANNRSQIRQYTQQPLSTLNRCQCCGRQVSRHV